MLIDCDSCTARPHACGDCVVTHLMSVGLSSDATTDRASPPTELTASEVAAVAVLAAEGLVPPLRLVTGQPPVMAVRQTPGRRRPRSVGTGVQAG